MILPSNSPSNIEGNLYLGNIMDATSQEKIKHIGITYILPVGSSNHPLFNQGMNKLKDVIYYPNYIDITDFHTENLLVHFMDAIKFIDESISKGKILVHCAAGVSRSAAIVIAYLMWKKKMESC